MNLDRFLAAALGLPLVAAGAFVVGSSQTASAARHDVAAPSMRVAAGLRIQGVVADAVSGRHLDDVDVEAVAEDGTVASDLTYASDRPGYDHGFFNLGVGRRGTYTVTFSRSGYVSQSQTVEVTRRPRVTFVEEVDLRPRLVATTTRAALKSSRITTSDKGRLLVQVTSKGTRKPTGEVTVMAGRQQVGSDTLTASDGGAVTIGLRQLPVGTYRITASFAGSRKLNLASSTSGATSLQVVRSRRH